VHGLGLGLGRQGHNMSNVVPVKVLQLKTINDTMLE